MKTYILSLFFTVALAGTIRAASDDRWPELAAFHTVMSQTFHPSEEGNLAPIREKIGEFVKKAEVLAASTVPPEFNNDKIKTALTELSGGSHELQAMIEKKDSDEAITKKLAHLHAVFHEIVEYCRMDDAHKGPGHHGHGHDHD
jgi:hypothetical protein